MAHSSWFGYSVRHGVLLAVQVALAAALAGIVLILAERHNRRFDLSPMQSFVLSDQSIKIARRLIDPVQIYAFYNNQDSGTRRQVEDLLEQFRSASAQIHFRLLDLDRSPALAKKYRIASYNTGVVEGVGRTIELKSFSEEEIASALLKLTAGGKRTLCFLTGHGEHSPQKATERRGYSEVAKALEKENFGIRTIERLPPGDVPEGCTVVISAGPSRDLFTGEAEQLDAYVSGGGRLLVLVDLDASASVLALLTRFGIAAGNDLIVDERNRLYGMDSFTPRVPGFDPETFRNNLELPAAFSLARSVRPSPEAPPGISAVVVAVTGPESWARIDGEMPPAGEARFRPEVDKNGPVPVAVIANVQRAAANGKPAAVGRVAVFGDSDFASNFYLNLMGNKDLFMSMVAVLAEEEDLVAVRRKGLQRGSLSPILLTARQGRQIFWSAVVLQPGILLLAGIAVTLRRRRRGGV